MSLASDPSLLALAAVSLLLYGLLAHRSWALLTTRGDPDPAIPGLRPDAAIVLTTSHLIDRLGAGLGVIRALITALPLLGLLGSVGGISDAFHAIHQAADGSSARVAAQGISLALIATQVGLVAAIPALVWERLLSRWVRSRAVSLVARVRQP